MSKLENIKEKVAVVVRYTLPYLKTAWKWTCVAAVRIALWTKAVYQWAKPHVIAGSKRVYRWFRSLQPRNQLIVAGVTGVLVLGLLWSAAARTPGKVDRSQDVLEQIVSEKTVSQIYADERFFNNVILHGRNIGVFSCRDFTHLKVFHQFYRSRNIGSDNFFLDTPCEHTLDRADVGIDRIPGKPSFKALGVNWETAVFP